MKIELVLLAAGFSNRFHANKLLYPYQGKPLIYYPFDAIQQSDIANVHVVTQYVEIQNIAQRYGYFCIWNAHPEKGISYSIQLGLQACKDRDAVLFLTADMPWIKAQTLRLMASMADTSHIICAWNEGIIQNPMCFPSIYFHELMMLQGDSGAKRIALQHLNACINFVLNPMELKDIDTIKDVND